MKIDIYQTVLALLLLTATSACVTPDFDKGKETYNKGETDLQKWQGLAEQGNAKAQFYLGLSYDNGEGIPKDDGQAVFWYRKAAERGVAEAQFNLGVMHYYGEGIPKDDGQAVFWYRKAAEQGVAEAQFNLGVMHYYGEGIPKDDGQAMFWYRKAAEQGVARAQFNLGNMYRTGRVVPKDDGQAMFWYRKAAEQGVARAQFNLGNMYRTGRVVPKDDGQAVLWYRKAAEQGDAKAQFNLGSMYRTGRGVPEDDRQAVFWYRKAAEQGVARAQGGLGFMYANGRGVPEDDRQAVFWYRKAAEQGDAAAQLRLGSMYANGRGVPEDDRQAVFWYRKAAEQGDAAAQYNLGVRYANGRGVPEDNVQAFAWFNLAAEQGDEDVRERAKERRYNTQQHMTSSQIEEGQKLSREIAARIERNQSDSDSSLFADAPDSVPKTSSLVQKLGHRTGSGFVIGRKRQTTFIVTNHHIVRHRPKVTVDYADKSYEAWVVPQANSRIDIALLKAKIPYVLPASFSFSPRARQHQTVTVAGYPLNPQNSNIRQFNVEESIIGTIDFPLDGWKWLQFTANIQRGNSGGPLLDNAGNVIGVVVGKIDSKGVLQKNFAIEAIWVRNFLDIHGVDYQWLPSETKLDPEKLAERARHFTVIVR